MSRCFGSAAEAFCGTGVAASETDAEEELEKPTSRDTTDERTKAPALEGGVSSPSRFCPWDEWTKGPPARAAGEAAGRIARGVASTGAASGAPSESLSICSRM